MFTAFYFTFKHRHDVYDRLIIRVRSSSVTRSFVRINIDEAFTKIPARYFSTLSMSNFRFVNEASIVNVRDRGPQSTRRGNILEDRRRYKSLKAKNFLKKFVTFAKWDVRKNDEVFVEHNDYSVAKIIHMPSCRFCTYDRVWIFWKIKFSVARNGTRLKMIPAIFSFC